MSGRGSIRAGIIVAVKGLGGFQLWADAGSAEAVQRLRVRKRRPQKPFAVMFPAADAMKTYCPCLRQRMHCSGRRKPRLCWFRRTEVTLAEAVAPGNPCLGAMLPATPLHHLLMAELQRPVVATSGNRSEEPIVTDEQEARSA